MAMKISKLTIHRLSVDMSCGCRMYAEFEDGQCKKPVGSDSRADGDEAPPVERVFKACDKHEKDNSISMLEFIIGERLDEAIVDANKAPAHLHHPPEFRGDTEDITGESVQTVARVNRPAAVQRQRPEQPPGVKTMVRSPEQLMKVGAAPRHAGGGSVEMQVDEVAEDEAATPHIEELLDILDVHEAGLFED